MVLQSKQIHGERRHHFIHLTARCWSFASHSSLPSLFQIFDTYLRSEQIISSLHLLRIFTLSETKNFIPTMAKKGASKRLKEPEDMPPTPIETVINTLGEQLKEGSTTYEALRERVQAGEPLTRELNAEMLFADSRASEAAMSLKALISGEVRDLSDEGEKKAERTLVSIICPVSIGAAFAFGEGIQNMESRYRPGGAIHCPELCELW